MPTTFDDTLVIGISSRALFDLTESHAIYEQDGLAAYINYQIAHENKPLAPGVAFAMVKKFLAINDISPDGKPQVEIVLISRNSGDTGLRIFNSIKAHELKITRAAFARGEAPYKYARPFGADLFLSAEQQDVKSALNVGIAAATILHSHSAVNSDQLKIAFDGDAVLFSDEAERIYQEQGLQAFTETERAAADRPLQRGPFMKVLAALCRIQKKYNESESPIRTALVTARSAPTHERVIKTLRDWKIHVDESLFLGGMDKGEFLRAFGADIFFDDQRGHCDSARQHVPTGHVEYGIANDIKPKIKVLK